MSTFGVSAPVGTPRAARPQQKSTRIHREHGKANPPMINIEFLIPFYGAADYLLQAIDGIRALEDTRWRVTIVEDADPDGHVVEEKVRALADDRIRYLRNDRNLGVNANIYQCIQ